MTHYYSSGLVNAKNRVPEKQRFYQQAYKNHTRLWKIGPRSGIIMTSFNIAMWGTFGASMYAMSRKVLGYNTWFSED
ncbi:unnamed protein product [Sordaria macrospora k-hell]|uniref:WGS project CABT00000000 data, contig 2.14 n=1 Tax=Sordaria macrospora (strain ATCC MYA-333 / DSM 997 / K(L3346) / K-hell) TaxID=771870 RepID=F7VYU3_SORMK|nr:uncharacterized protein SMAC_04472 [Sordaria macrospora k-hell]CCC10689.1 unnamed protein product [Sordaria macrospora k-hell]